MTYGIEEQTKFDRLKAHINAIIPWSSISAIGNSTPARLTLLAPLVGYLIIYNRFIADFFFLSNSGTELQPKEATILDLFRDLKLTFLYFGLLFFGMGALLFAAFAPRNIRKYKSPEEFVLKMEAAQTDWLVIDNFTRVGRAAWSGEEYFSNPDGYGSISLSFTDETFYQLDAILEFAGQNAYAGSDEASPDLDVDFYTMTGGIKTANVLESILAQRRVDRAIWGNCIQAIVEHRARDVFYMAYTFEEWSRFRARLSCAIMFTLGGLFLLVPTVITSVEVISEIGR